MTFNYEISIEASNESEAQTKMEAALILIKKLQAQEIAKLAHIVKNDPVTTAMAKKALGISR